MADSLKFILSPSINNGYPSIIGLSDITNLKVQSSPFPTLIDKTFNSNINEGYPIKTSVGDVSKLYVQKKPFPKVMLSIGKDVPEGWNDGYPANLHLGDVHKLYIQKKPFPKVMLFIGKDVPEGWNDGYPTNLHLGDVHKLYIQKKPFPKVMLSLEDDITDGYLSHRHDEPFFGAFSNIPTLEKVTIPRSVKEIADYAFYNTNVKKVTISPDCNYGKHTFPEECIIEFYENDE